jgi:hypothetical protein
MSAYTPLHTAGGRSVPVQLGPLLERRACVLVPRLFTLMVVVGVWERSRTTCHLDAC